MPSKIQRVSLGQWTPGIQPTWTVSGVRSALQAHEQGQFVQSARLIDAMGRSDRLSAVTETRLKGLFSSPFEIEPAETEEEDQLAQDIADAVGRRWLDMFPEADLAELWRWRLFAGVGLGELKWETYQGEWYPRLEVWHLQWVTADETEKRYEVTTANNGTVYVPFGGGDGKWIVLGRGSRPWMNGLVRGLAIPWLGEAFAFRDWLRYSERHGMPIVKAMTPAIADDVDKEDFFDDIKALSNETTVQLPTHLTEQGAAFDVQLLEATADTWEAFQGLLRHIHDSYAIALTGNNLSTLIEGGSFAAAKEAGTVRSVYSSGDAEELSTQLRQQALVQYVGYNYTDSDERVPWPKWDTEPAEDAKANAEVMGMVATAVGSMLNNRIPVDIQAMAEKFGIPIDTEADLKAAEQLFRYHIEFGVLTVNEVRERLNLPPLPGGDVRATLPANPAEQAQASRVTLASGDNPATARGFIEGQVYTDALADSGVKAMRSEGGPSLADLGRVIDTSTDPSDLRARLREVYAETEPDEFAAILERAIILAMLNGRYAVEQDA